MSYITSPDPKKKKPEEPKRTPLEQKIAEYVYNQYKKGELKWTNPKNPPPGLTVCDAHYDGELKAVDGSIVTVKFFYYGKEMSLNFPNTTFLRINFDDYGEKILKDRQETEDQRIRRIQDEEAASVAKRLGIDMEEQEKDPLEELGCRFVHRTELKKEPSSLWCYLGAHTWQTILDCVGPDGHRHMTRACQCCERKQYLGRKYKADGRMKLVWMNSQCGLN